MLNKALILIGLLSIFFFDFGFCQCFLINDCTDCLRYSSCAWCSGKIANHIGESKSFRNKSFSKHLFQVLTTVLVKATSIRYSAIFSTPLRFALITQPSTRSSRSLPPKSTQSELALVHETQFE